MIKQSKPTYEAVCWTCGLESNSIEWAREHAKTGGTMADYYPGPHAVRVTTKQDMIFNAERS